MSERLTPERLVEIRAEHATPRWGTCSNGYHVATLHDELLPHIAALEAEIEAGNNAIGRALDEAGEAWSQVAALREGLQALANAVADWNEDVPLHCTASEQDPEPDQGCRFCGTVDAEWVRTCPWRAQLVKVVTALAETEAAAKAHDQRMQLEGAREFMRRIGRPYSEFDVVRAALTDMEREP